MQKRIFFIASLFFIVIVSVFFLPRLFNLPKEIHYHAGFKVFKNGKAVNFSDYKYMFIEPCSNSKKETKEDKQIKKAHLHDEVGDVVHVEEENAVWGDLFKNLKYEIDYQDTKSFINGKSVDNIPTLKIEPYQSLVVFIGKNNDIQKDLKEAATKKHIQEVEKQSGDCGK